MDENIGADFMEWGSESIVIVPEGEVLFRRKELCHGFGCAVTVVVKKERIAVNSLLNKVFMVTTNKDAARGVKRKHVFEAVNWIRPAVKQISKGDKCVIWIGGVKPGCVECSAKCRIK